MKKLYATSQRSDSNSLRFSCHLPLVKAVSLGTAMAALLSSVSPVFAANVSITGALIRSTNGTGVDYPRGSHGSIVFAGDDDYCGVDVVTGRGGPGATGGRVITPEEEYKRFIENQKYNNRNPYGTTDHRVDWTGNGTTSTNGGYMGQLTGGATNNLPTAYGVYSFVTGCGAYASGNYSTAFGAGATTLAGGAQAFGVSALASGTASIAFGIGSEASGESSVSVGGLSKVTGKNSVAVGIGANVKADSALAAGNGALSEADSSVAVGESSAARASASVALGKKAEVLSGADGGIAFGGDAQVSVENGVALGSSSAAVTAAGIQGYDPKTEADSLKQDSAWKSTSGALSIGNVGKGITRQITGVAAGSQDTDAVNIAQLKELSELVQDAGKGWSLLVDNGSLITIGAKSESAKIDVSGSGGITRTVSGLTDGSISATSTQAITGKQLYETRKEFAHYLDGKAGYDSDGDSWTNPSFEVHGQKAESVSDAFSKIDAAVSKIEKGETGLVRDDLGAQTITIGAESGSTKIDVSGKGKITRVISGVKGEELTENSTYAVSGAQLWKVDDKASKINKNINKYLGGGADVLEGTEPNFTIQSESAHSVAEAFNKVGTSLGSLEGNINGVKAEVAQVENNITNNISKNSLMWDQGEGVFSASHGEEKTASVIRHIKDGKIASDSTEAVTGKQLYKTRQEFAHYLDGKAGYNSDDDSWTNPTFEVHGQQATNVADAFSKIDAVVSKIEKGETGLVRDNLNTKTITIGVESESAKIDVSGEGKRTRAIVGVKGEALEENSTYAVSGAQLWKVDNKADKINENINKYLGGGANVLEGTELNFTIQSERAHNVADAFGKVDTSLGELNQSIISVKNDIADITNNVAGGILKNTILWNTSEDAFVASHGEEKTASVIRYIKGGKIAADSTEAITGKQLYDTRKEFAHYLDGKAGYNSDGDSWTNPNFEVHGQKAESVADAFNKIDAVVSKIEKGETGLVRDDLGAQTITIGAESGSTKIDVSGKGKITRAISGVKGEELTENSTYAVSGAQLWKVDDKASKINKNINKYLGGGADILEGTEPNFTIQSESVHSVAEAFNKVGTSLDGLEGNINGVKTEVAQVTNTVTNNILKNSLMWDQNEGVFSASHGGDGDKTPSTIRYIKDGKIASDSTEAVTGKQLYKTRQEFAHYLDGKAGYNSDGDSWTNPTFEVHGQQTTNVADAFSKIDTVVSKIEKGETGLVKDNLNTKTITIGAEGESTKIDVSGEGKRTRAIVGVKGEALEENSTYAVSGAQLWKVDNKADKINENINKYLGGGANVLEGTELNFTIQSERAHNVADAFGKVDTSLGELKGSINDVKNDVTNITNTVTGNLSKNALMWNDSEGAFVASHGDSKTPSKIKHILDGDISAESSEAITGGQLYDTRQKIARYLDGKAGYDRKGEWTDPSFKIRTISEDGDIGEKDYDTVAGALADVGGSLKNIRDGLKHEIDNALVKEDSGVITVGAQSSAGTINVIGQGGQKRVLSGLGEGQISAGSTDAVTGGQLHTVDQKVAGLGTAVENAQGNVGTIAANINKYLGGQADILGGAEPTFTVQGNSSHNVADAFGKVDHSLGEIKGDLNDVRRDVTDITNNITSNISKNALMWSDEESAFVAFHGGDKTPTKIKHVLDGDISTTSSDAITGGQLYDTRQEFASYLDGKAGYDRKGQWTDPSFKIRTIGRDGDVGEEEYDTVAGALADVGGSLKNIRDGLQYEIDNALVKENGGVITIGAQSGASTISVTGKSGQKRILSGLGEGQISAESTDAVTGGQLFTVDKKVADLGTTITNTQDDLSEVKGNVGTIATNINKYLGGQADILGGEAPTFTVQGNSSHNVADAFGKVDTSLGELKGNISDVENKLTDATNNITGNISKNALMWSDEESAFVASHGDGKAPSKIKHVLDGDVSAASSDAVTGGQLYDTHQEFAHYLDGKAGYDRKGQWTDPSFKIHTIGRDGDVGEEEYDTVAGALADVGGSLKNIRDGLQHEIDNALVKEDSGVITIGAQSSAGTINVTGQGGQKRVLSGLADGKVLAGSTDAVTGGQLFTVDKKVADLGTTITNTQGDLSEVKGNVGTIATNINKYLGGQADILGGEAPTFTVQGNSSHNVADAFGKVDTSLGELKGNISDVENKLTDATNNITGNISKNALMWSDEESAFVASHGDGKAPSKIKHVLDGDVSAASSDAVTGGQLYDTHQEFAHYLDGKAGYDRKGEWTDPSFKIHTIGRDGDVGEEEYDTVAGALADVGGSLKNIRDGLQHEIDNALVKEDSGVITVGAQSSAGTINVTGQGGQKRILSGLEEGKVLAGSTDAVTGGQLFTVDQKVTDLGTAVENAQGNVGTIAANINKYLGGQADVLGGEAPTFTVQGNSSHNVADAFGKVDTSLGELKGNISDVENKLTDATNNITGNLSKNALMWNDSEGAFVASHGDGKAPSKIKHILDGDVSAASSEAITGAQLYDTRQEFASYLDGKAGYDRKGEWTDPSFKIHTISRDGDVGEEEYDTVAGALEDVGGSLKNIRDGLKHEIDNALVKENGGVITIGAQSSAGTINVTGQGGQKRVLSGLAEGKVFAGSTDAVTGGQLFTVDQKVTDLGTAVENAQGNVGTIAANINKYLGGQVDVLGGEAPTFTVQGNSSHNVADAFGKVDTSLGELKGNISDVENKLTDVASNITGNLSKNALMWSDEEGAFAASHGDGKTPSKIKHLLGGDISATSSDAITGGQLYDTRQEFAHYLDGKAGYDRKGQWTDPSFKIRTIGRDGDIDEKEYDTVAGALADVGGSLENIRDGLQYEIDNALVKEDRGVITIGAQSGANTINVTGKGGQKRVLSGLAEGKVLAGSTDAVTGGQLFTVDKKVANLGATITNAQGDLLEVQDNVGAIAANINKYLGGRADVLEGEAPTFTVQGNSYHNVADAFGKVSTSLGNLEGSISEVKTEVTQITSNVTNITSNMLQGALMWSDLEEAFDASHGENKTPSKITNLLGGMISAASTEAVTGSQLHDMGTKLATFLGGGAQYKGGEWTGPTFGFNIIDLKGNFVLTENKSVTEAFHNVANSVENVNSRLQHTIDNALVKENGGVITIGAESNADIINVIGSVGQKRVLSGLADGKVLAGSTDAVTGGQLFTVDKKVANLGTTITNTQGDLLEVQDNVGAIAANINKYLGGQADVLGGREPTFKVQGNSYHNVADAFGKVDRSLGELKGNISDVENKLTDVTNNITGNVLQNALMWDDIEGAFVASHGENKTPSKITNLLGGKISAESTEAVAGSQLHDMGTKLATYLGGGAQYKEGEWTGPTFGFNVIDGSGNLVLKKSETVAEALQNVASSVENVHYEFQHEIDNALVKEDKGVITVGAQSTANAVNVIGSNGQKRVLSGLADGKVLAGSTDAVTGGQLFTVEQKVAGLGTTITNAQGDLLEVQDNVGAIAANINKYLGGQADVLGGREPTFKVQGNSYHNVADAFGKVDHSLGEIKGDINDVKTEVAQITNNVTGDLSKNALMWSDEEGAFVASHGDGKTSSKIKHLLGGDISATSTEAITGGQLYDTRQEFAHYLDGKAGYDRKGKWTDPSFKIHTVGKDGDISEKEYDTVAGALADVGGSLENIRNGFKHEIDNALVKEDKGVITVGAQSTANAINVIGSNGQKRVLSGLADGKVLFGSTDAVTGGQLFVVDQNIKKIQGDMVDIHGGLSEIQDNLGDYAKIVSKYLGGGARVADDIQPSYYIQQEIYHDVGSAFKAVDVAFDDIGVKFSDEIKKLDKKISGNILQNTLFWSDDEGAFIASRNSSGNGKLTKLLDGDISAGSSDAITGNQLYSMSNQIAAYFGGGANYKNGRWTSPTFTVDVVDSEGNIISKESKTVAGALKHVSDSFKNISHEAETKSERGVGNFLVAEDEGIITIGAKSSARAINVAGKDGNRMVLSGLEEGRVSSDSNDAVTGSQLYVVNKNVSDLDATITDTQNSLSEVREDVGSIYTNINKYLGGQADVLGGREPTFTVQGNSYHNVADAFGGVSNSLGKIDQSIDSFGNKLKDALMWSDLEEAFDASHGENKTPSKITNLLGGMISAASTEAVTGSQLHDMGTKLATFFGGGAQYKGGEWTGPTFGFNIIDLKGNFVLTESKSVAEAFHNVANSVENVNSRLQHTIDNALVKENGEIITIGAESNADIINVIGSVGQKRVLSGLAEGKVVAGSTDAVTGGQLFTVNKKVIDLDTAVKNAQHDISEVQGNVGEIADNINRYLGGQADVLKGNAPSYTIQGKGYQGVDRAFAAVNRSFDNIKQEFNENIGEIKDEILGQVTDNALLWDDSENAFVALHKNGGGSPEKGTLKYLKNGDVSSDSTEAITGSQLHHLGTKLAAYLGGGAQYEQGVWTADPTFKVGIIDEEGNVVEKESNTVAGALADVSSSISNLQQGITNGLVQEDKANDRITIGKESKLSKVYIGAGDDARTLLGVAAGDISEGSTDAVNGSQIFAYNKQVSEYLGGGADITAGTGPVYEIQGEKHQSIGDTLAAVDESFDKIKEEFSENIGGIEDNILGHVTESALLWDNDEGAFVALHKHGGGSPEKSTLKYLKDGDVSSDSTEAITGSQLHHLGTKLAAYLGGGAQYEQGVWTADPTFKVGIIDEEGNVVEKESDTVAGALADVSSSISKLQQGAMSSLIQEDEANDRITIGKKSKLSKVYIGAGENARILSGVAGGDISEKSTDAVNGSQIFAYNKQVSEYLGGGADITAGTGPVYEIQGEKHQSIGDTLAAVDESFDKIKEEFSENIGGIEDNILGHVTESALLWDNDEGAFVALHKNSEGVREKEKLTKLLDGSISADSTDAITGKQLYETRQEFAHYLSPNAGYDNGQWNNPVFKVLQFNANGEISLKDYASVAEAFGGVNESLEDLNNRLNGMQNAGGSSSGNGGGSSPVDGSSSGNGGGSSSGNGGGSSPVDGSSSGNGGGSSSGNGGGSSPVDGSSSGNGGGSSSGNGGGSSPVDGSSSGNGGGSSSGNGGGSSPVDGSSSGNGGGSSSGNGGGSSSGNGGGSSSGNGGGSSSGNGGGSSSGNGGGSSSGNEGGSSSGNGGGSSSGNGGGASSGNGGGSSSGNGGGSSSGNGGGSSSGNGGGSSSGNGGGSSSGNGDGSSSGNGGGSSSGNGGGSSSGNGGGSSSGNEGGSSSGNGGGSSSGNEGGSSSGNGGGSSSGNGGGSSSGNGDGSSSGNGGGSSSGNGGGSSSGNGGGSSSGNGGGSSSGNGGGAPSVNEKPVLADNVLSWNEGKGAYDATHDGKDGKITNVADGKIEKDSTDAVNGGQIAEIQQNMEQNINALENKVNNIDVDGVKLGNIVQYTTDEDGKKKIVLEGARDGEPVMIENVADGRVEEGSKDAINGGVLKKELDLVFDNSKKYTDEKIKSAVEESVAQANSYTDFKFNALSYGIEEAKQEAKQAAAIGIAMASLRYGETPPGKTSIAFGSGVWRGQSAFAFGMGYTSEDGNIRPNISVTTSGGHWGVGAGLNIILD